MVRLNPVDPDLAATAASDEQSQESLGAQAQVVDDLLSNYRTKEPKSSLDYKAPAGGGADQVLPPPIPKNENEQQQQHTMELNYEQFAGMTPDEIVQKIQDNPELLLEAQKQQQQQSSSSAKTPPPSSSSSSSSKKSRQRLEKLGIDQSKQVPVAQWVILLLLMAYGAWKLYASKQQHAAAANKKIATNRSATSKTKTGNTKSKQQQAKGKNGAPKQETAKKTPKAATETTGNKKKKPKTKPSKPAVTFKQESEEDSDSDSSSSSSDRAKPAAKPNAAVTMQKAKSAPAPVQQAVLENDIVEDGWQTVKGGNGVANDKKPKANKLNGSVNTPSATQESVADAPPSVAVPATVAMSDAAVVNANPSNGVATSEPAAIPQEVGFVAAPTSSKNKKKKKKRLTSDAGSTISNLSASSSTASPNTEADAALAARLQEAENNFDAPAEEDDWAQVSKRSKPKREKAKESEEAAAVAAEGDVDVAASVAAIEADGGETQEEE